MTEQNSLENILNRLRLNQSGALEDLRWFAAGHPDSAAAWAHLAWNLNGFGFIEEADAAGEHLLILLPQSADAHRLQARICFQRGLFDQAISHFQTASTLSPESQPDWLELIELFLYQGKPVSAWMTYRQLKMGSSPGSPFPPKLFSKILASLVISLLARFLLIPSLRNAFFGNAYRYFAHKNQWGRALVLARSLAAVDPSQGLWPERAAEAIYQKRDYFFPDYEKEIAWRALAFRFNPEKVDGLARAHLHAGHACTAVQLLHQNPPRSLAGQATQAHALAATGLMQEAIALYRALSPSQSIHAINTGIVNLQSENYADAMAALDAALHQEPDNPLAVFLFEIARRKAAGESFNAVRFDSVLQECAIRYGWRERICEQRTDWAALRNQQLASGRLSLISCPGCGAHSDRPICYDPLSRWLRVRCDRCGLHYTNPQPAVESIPGLYKNDASQSSSLQRFFRQTFNQILAQPADETAAHLLRKESWWEPEFSLHDFEKLCGSRRRMLDIGCSVGAQLVEYQRRGWQAIGIDLDDNAVSFARSQGLDARLAALEEAVLEEESFDLITLLDVIEHLPDHKPALQKLSALLRPGGLLKIKTPCAESLIHYFYGPPWLFNDTHLLYFSRSRLLHTLQDYGFEITATRSYLEVNKLNHTYTRWRDFSITPLFDPLVSRWNIGDTILVLARKPSL